MKYFLPLLFLALCPSHTLAQRDGQHDFDWEIGTWKTHLRRLQRPLSGSTTWVEYDGTTIVRPVEEDASTPRDVDRRASE